MSGRSALTVVVQNSVPVARVGSAHEPPGLAITYAGLSQKEEARKVLNQLIQQADSTYFPGEEIAAVYVSLGENDEAIHWLERAVSEHSGAIQNISFSRDLRPLHSDPRFVALLRRIGLDPAKSLRRERRARRQRRPLANGAAGTRAT